MPNIITRIGSYSDFAKPTGFGLVRASRALAFSSKLLKLISAPRDITPSFLAKQLLHSKVNFCNGKIIESDIKTVMEILNSTVGFNDINIKDLKNILEGRDDRFISNQKDSITSKFFHTLLSPRILYFSTPIINNYIEERLMSGDPAKIDSKIQTLLDRVKTAEQGMIDAQRNLDASLCLIKSSEEVQMLINRISREGVLLAKDELVKTFIENFIEIGCNNINLDRGTLFMKTKLSDGSEVLKAVAWWGRNEEKIKGIEEFLENNLELPLDDRNILIFKERMSKQVKKFALSRSTAGDIARNILADYFSVNKLETRFEICENNFSEDERKIIADNIDLKKRLDHFYRIALRYGWDVSVENSEGNLTAHIIKNITVGNKRHILKFGSIDIGDSKRYDEYPHLTKFEYLADLIEQFEGNISPDYLKTPLIFEENIFNNLNITADGYDCSALNIDEKKECWKNIWNFAPSIILRTLREGRGFHISNVLKPEYFIDSLLIAMWGTKSFITVPVRNIRGEVAGVLAFDRDTSQAFISEKDLKIANDFAYFIENLFMKIDRDRTYFQSLTAFAKAVEAKDNYTGGHIDRVGKFSMAIAKELDLDIQQIEKIKYFAPLHDIGKIGVADAVLKKQAGLTDEEFTEIKIHPQMGYEILKTIEAIDEESKKMIKQHQERWDGRGYPSGTVSKPSFSDFEGKESEILQELIVKKYVDIQGKISPDLPQDINDFNLDIPLTHEEKNSIYEILKESSKKLAFDLISLLARIVAVADTYDAMASDRPYRKRLPFMERVYELIRCAGTQFDPEVAEAMLSAFSKDKALPEDEKLSEVDKQKLASATASFGLIKDFGIFGKINNYIGEIKIEGDLKIFVPNPKYNPSIPQQLLHYIVVDGHRPSKAHSQLINVYNKLIDLKNKNIDAAKFIRDNTKLYKGGIKEIGECILLGKSEISPKSINELDNLTESLHDFIVKLTN